MSGLQVSKTFNLYRVGTNISCLIEAGPPVNTASAYVKGEFWKPSTCFGAKSLPTDLDVPATAQDLWEVPDHWMCLRGYQAIEPCFLNLISWPGALFRSVKMVSRKHFRYLSSSSSSWTKSPLWTPTMLARIVFLVVCTAFSTCISTWFPCLPTSHWSISS